MIRILISKINNMLRRVPYRMATRSLRLVLIISLWSAPLEIIDLQCKNKFDHVTNLTILLILTQRTGHQSPYLKIKRIIENLSGHARTSNIVHLKTVKMLRVNGQSGLLNE